MGTVTLVGQSTNRPIDLGGADSATTLGLTDAELDTFIAECIEAAGAMSVKDLGKVMGVIKARAAGRVDMSTVSTRVRSMLTAD